MTNNNPNPLTASYRSAKSCLLRFLKKGAHSVVLFGFPEGAFYSVLPTNSALSGSPTGDLEVAGKSAGSDGGCLQWDPRIVSHVPNARGNIEILAYNPETHSSPTIAEFVRSDIVDSCSNLSELENYVRQRLPVYFDGLIVHIIYNKKAHPGEESHPLTTHFYDLLDHIDQIIVIDISACLRMAESPNDDKRKNGEYGLIHFQRTNPAGFFLSFVREMANGTESRRLAAIALSNAVSVSTEQTLTQMWAKINADVKSQIKESLVRAFRYQAQEEVRRIAASLIYEIAVIDFPKKQWPDLFSSLQADINSQNFPFPINQEILEIIGKLCEGLSPPELEASESDIVLAAIYYGIGLAINQDQAFLAGLRSLSTAIVFCKKNF